MICPKCEQDKSLESFYRNNQRRSGRALWCKECHNTLYYIPHPKKTYTKPLSLLCKECKTEKPLTEFPNEPRLKVGVRQPCKDCYARKNREKRAENPEPALIVRRARSAKKRQLLNQQHKDWLDRDGNRDRVNAKQRAKRAANPLPFREQERKYVGRKRERRQARGRTRDPILRAKGQRAFAMRKARKKNLPHAFGMKEREFMMQYFGYACAICRRQEGFEWTIALDHWIPISSPDCPGTVATNMIPLCHSKQGSHQSCNSTKLSREASEWLCERFGRAKAARLLKAIETYFALVRQRAAQQGAVAD